MLVEGVGWLGPSGRGDGRVVWGAATRASISGQPLEMASHARGTLSITTATALHFIFPATGPISSSGTATRVSPPNGDLGACREVSLSSNMRYSLQTIRPAIQRLTDIVLQGSQRQVLIAGAVAGLVSRYALHSWLLLNNKLTVFAAS
jgi:hypothetical protein